MKCDELEKWDASLFSPSAMVYGTFEVDEAIAELKAQNESLKAKLAEKDEEIESLKASHYAEMVDAGMRERRLRRLLWRAIALFCARSCEYFSGRNSRR